jgi:predicted nuclease of predicted toxin-antitoxin system
MSVKILIDMNLSPDWVTYLHQHGWSAVHWSTVGDARAADSVLFEWEQTNQHIVFTHDLDFGVMLALSHAVGPSVLQVRTQDPMPDRIGTMVIAALRQHDADLAIGALVVVDASRSRVRILPLS